MKLIGKLKALFRRRPTLKQLKAGKLWPRHQFTLFEKEVNKLTNWQKSQWARRGYPRNINIVILLQKAVKPCSSIVHAAKEKQS